MAVHDDDNGGGGEDAVGGDGISIRLLHLGNSIQYYNDCPWLLKEMILHSTTSTTVKAVEQKICLRGGSNFTSLAEKGTHWFRRMIGGDYGCNSLEELFEEDSSQENWDYTFVIMNDHTQSPARASTSRQDSLKVLQSIYKDYLQKLKGHVIPILIETAAYSKDNTYGSKDIGNFDDFTKAVVEGCQMYQQKLQQSLAAATTEGTAPCVVYVCPLGTATQQIRNTSQEDSSKFNWKKLYSFDYKHPSPHGTLLQAYLLYLIINQHITSGQGGGEVKEEKSVPLEPKYEAKWIDAWHYMSVPTQEEAKQLLEIATNTILKQQQQQQEEQQQKEGK